MVPYKLLAYLYKKKKIFEAECSESNLLYSPSSYFYYKRSFTNTIV